MKILYAIASVEVGGAEVLFSDLARGLRARGHEADCLVPAEHRRRSDELPDPGFGRILEVERDDWHGGGPALEAALEGYDLVNLSLFGPQWRRGLAAAGRPIVHTVHSLVGWTLWYTHNFYQGEPVAAVATVDAQTAAYVRDLWPRGLIVRHIRNGIDLEAFEPPSASRDLRSRAPSAPPDAAAGKARGSEPLVVTVGRVSPWAKHHSSFARVAGLVQSRARAEGRPVPRFRIVGGARPEHRPLEDRLKALAAEAGGEIEVTGIVSPEEVRGHLAEASVFLLTSSTEGSPIAILEAMASGLPIVATAVGGVPELLIPPPGGPRRGVLKAVDDDEGMAAGVEAYLADPGAARAAGRAGRDYVEAHHRIESTIDAYENLYREVLGRP